MIREGLARVVIPDGEWTDITINSYLSAQKEARRLKRGIWAHKGYVTKDGFDPEIGRKILQDHEAAERRARQKAEARKRKQIEEEKAYHRQIKQALDKRSEEHTSELQSRENLVCRLLLEKKNNNT